MNVNSQPYMPDVHGGRRPFFSIICCTYQRADLLPRAIQSVLAQTETDWELIIVDDGSTDDTWQVVQRYAANVPSIRYLWHTNRGTGRSRNAGLLASTGLFVTFIDSDDEYRSDHLFARRSALVDSPFVEFVHGGVTIIGDPYVIDKDDPSVKIHLDQCVVGGTFVVRRDVLIDLGGFDDVRYADDAMLYARASAAGVIIARIDHPSYIYHRDTPDSLCSTYAT